MLGIRIETPIGITKRGLAAEKDQDYFAAAFHFAWAMENNSDPDLNEKFKKEFWSMPSELQSKLRERRTVFAI